jgi:peptidoglycan/xylan/chitin deacetylase (PgdA/CDA1 family)
VEVAYWWADDNAKAHEEHHRDLWKSAIDEINTYEDSNCHPVCWGDVLTKAIKLGQADGEFINTAYDYQAYGNLEPELLQRMLDNAAKAMKAATDLISAQFSCNVQ